ncbi:MAG: tetratricopeptide repeat protein [Nitrospinae bacterium]|nr:tetratricopeptide repeat protein [Nitrospinota bacterium]
MREFREALKHSEYDYAEGELLEALPLAEILGESDRGLASVLYQLGKVYRRQKDFTKAEPYFWRALPIWVKSVGAERPEMATSLTGLARLYEAKHEYQKAEPLVKQAQKIRENAFGMDHPKILPSLEEYSSLLKLMNRDLEAKKLDTRRKTILTK